jgi:hypothetical protein
MHDKIAINYVESGVLYNRKTIVVDIFFASKIAGSMDLDPKPKSMAKCQKCSDWNKWKAAIEAELRSLVFVSAVPTPPKVIPVGNGSSFERGMNMCKENGPSAHLV